MNQLYGESVDHTFGCRDYHGLFILAYKTKDMHGCCGLYFSQLLTANLSVTSHEAKLVTKAKPFHEFRYYNVIAMT